MRPCSTSSFLLGTLLLSALALPSSAQLNPQNNFEVRPAFGGLDSLDIELPCPPNCGDGNSGGEATEAGNETVHLSNHYDVTFLGVSYSGNKSTWRYYVEELPAAQDLSNWVLGLPSCATVVSASPKGELVNPDPNARISGIKWQPGGGFVEGEFSVTLSGTLTVGRIMVAVKGPDVAHGELAGPACGG